VKLGVSPFAEHQRTAVCGRPEAFHLGDEEDVIAPPQPYAMSFAAPMNAKGLKILSRRSYEKAATT
jgi:hypothetical protein